jgi:DNA replication protein DnaC
MFMDGYTVYKDEYGQEYVKPTEQHILEQRKIRLKFALKDTGVSAPSFSLEQYKGEDKNSNLPKIKKYIAEFGNRYRNINLYFWSRGNASQKTTVAKNILTELALQGYSCRFILMADLLSLLQTETYNHGTESKAINVLRSVDFLVIDDAFDPRKSTLYKSGYQFSFIDTFLRYRLESVNGATCFTSNVPIEEIAKSWTPSIASLVERNVPTPMEFSDYITDFKTEDIWA